ncbi:MAG: hypothetical protein JNK85_23855 [Verrucomicrobiales bacterium]|nr:hypothetical protein [Verrucomicrobiales bacterium]
MSELPKVESQSNTNPSQPQLLSKREIAAYLRVTTRTVEIYQRLGLPFFRLGPRRNRYDLATVRDWLQRHCRRGLTG